MEWKLLITVFGAVFIAEMADKTQLVTMLFAADKGVSKLTVFLGSALALVLTSAIGVLAGTLLSHADPDQGTVYLIPKFLQQIRATDPN